MEPTAQTRAELEALRDEGVRRGLVYGMDFAIAYVPVSMSSEVVLLALEDDAFVVHYRDMGQNRELSRAATLDGVAERFLEEAARLAGPRGRGPYAGGAVPTEFDGMTQDEIIEEYRRRGFAF